MAFHHSTSQHVLENLKNYLLLPHTVIQLNEITEHNLCSFLVNQFPAERFVLLHHFNEGLHINFRIHQHR